VWPALRWQARQERRTLAFVDETGFYLLPGLVKTYAPKDLTPVVYESQTRDHLLVMGAITTEENVYPLMRQESLNGLYTVQFLSLTIVYWRRGRKSCLCNRLRRHGEAEFASSAGRHLPFFPLHRDTDR
jgi:hypothetical protein